MELQDIKDHIDEKFKNHEEVDSLRHDRINELLKHYSKEIDGNEETIKRVHERVDDVERRHDRLQTKIKTVQGVGTAIATALGAVGAWIGLTKGG